MTPGTAGHGEVSEALAERVLLPRVCAAADLDSGGREGMHLAELVADLTRPGSARNDARGHARPSDIDTDSRS